jgi:plastocyanin
VWQADGGTTNSATIAAGGTVTISYPQGYSAHNADFGGGTSPSGCTQLAGANSGVVPPLPHQPTSPGWSGTCTFKTAGTYTFHCDLHPFMTATIHVVAGPPPTTSTTTTGTTTTTTTGPTTTETAAPQPGPTSSEPGTTTSIPAVPSTSTPTTGTPSPAEPPAAIHPPPVAARAIAIGAVRHEPTVRGSANISAAGVGGRLDVYVFTSPRSLGSRAGHWILVGRLVRARLTAGTVRFSVPLTARADRTLHRRSLMVVVGVIVRSPRAGTAWTIRRVLLS